MVPGRLAAAFVLAEGRTDRRREGLRFLDVRGEVGLVADLTPRSERAAFHRLTAGVPPRAGSAIGQAPAETGVAAKGALAATVEPGLVSELLETVADAAIPVRLVLPGAGLWLSATTLLGNPVARAGRIRLHGAGVRLDLAGGDLCRAEVRRVTVGEGRAHAVDLVDGRAHRVLRLLGQDVPGRPEDRAWRTLVGGLLPAEAV